MGSVVLNGIMRRRLGRAWKYQVWTSTCGQHPRSRRSTCRSASAERQSRQDTHLQKDTYFKALTQAIMEAWQVQNQKGAAGAETQDRAAVLV